MSILQPKTTPVIRPKKPPPETEVIRNPTNRARGKTSSLPSILTAGLAGQSAGKSSLGGGV